MIEYILSSVSLKYPLNTYLTTRLTSRYFLPSELPHPTKMKMLAVGVDFSKVFDTISHGIFLKKLIDWMGVCFSG